jgi:hypothetical protein
MATGGVKTLPDCVIRLNSKFLVPTLGVFAFITRTDTNAVVFFEDRAYFLAWKSVTRHGIILSVEDLGNENPQEIRGANPWHGAGASGTLTAAMAAFFCPLFCDSLSYILLGFKSCLLVSSGSFGCKQ